MKTILFSNYDFDEEEVKNDMLECGYDEEYITEDTLFEFWHDECLYWWEDIDAQLYNLLDGEKHIVYGEVERWNGQYSGANISDDWKESWYSMTKDCDYIELYVEDGDLKVKCSHHDGTNFFTIRKLNEEGVELWEDWLCDYEDSTPEEVIIKSLIVDYSIKVGNEML